MSQQEQQVKKSLEKIVDDLQCQVDFSKISKSLMHKGIIVDFWIPSLKCVIEVHGVQHYKPSGFGRNKVETLTQYTRQVCRDERLKNFCNQFSLNYIEIPYDQEVTSSYVWNLILPLMGDE